jgi:HrpA-like RNA helicase
MLIQNRDGVWPDGNILVFCPGEAEIERMYATVKTVLGRHGDDGKRFDIIRIFRGHQTNEELDASLKDIKLEKVVSNGQQYLRPRRWIALSTNIGETSITFPRLGYVIDSGMTKRKSFNARLGADEFLTCFATQGEILQRMGRCGRTEDGYFFPMYDRETYERADPHPRAPVRRVDYSQQLLVFLAEGMTPRDIVNFDWISELIDKLC